MAVLPRVHAMVICDEIIRSHADPGVCDLLGARTEICADSFPYTHSELWIYLQMTRHQGVASGRVVVKNEGDQDVFWQPVVDVQFAGPLEIMVLTVGIADCEFPEPGLYYVQVVFEEKLIHERRLLLTSS